MSLPLLWLQYILKNLFSILVFIPGAFILMFLCRITLRRYILSLRNFYSESRYIEPTSVDYLLGGMIVSNFVLGISTYLIGYLIENSIRLVFILYTVFSLIIIFVGVFFLSSKLKKYILSIPKINFSHLIILSFLFEYILTIFITPLPLNWDAINVYLPMAKNILTYNSITNFKSYLGMESFVSTRYLFVPIVYSYIMFISGGLYLRFTIVLYFVGTVVSLYSAGKILINTYSKRIRAKEGNIQKDKLSQENIPLLLLMYLMLSPVLFILITTEGLYLDVPCLFFFSSLIYFSFRIYQINQYGTFIVGKVCTKDILLSLRAVTLFYLIIYSLALALLSISKELGSILAFFYVLAFLSITSHRLFVKFISSLFLFSGSLFLHFLSGYAANTTNNTFITLFFLTLFGLFFFITNLTEHNKYHKLANRNLIESSLSRYVFLFSIIGLIPLSLVYVKNLLTYGFFFSTLALSNKKFLESPILYQLVISLNKISIPTYKNELIPIYLRILIPFFSPHLGLFFAPFIVGGLYFYLLGIRKKKLHLIKDFKKEKHFEQQLGMPLNILIIVYLVWFSVFNASWVLFDYRRLWIFIPAVYLLSIIGLFNMIRYFSSCKKHTDDNHRGFDNIIYINVFLLMFYDFFSLNIFNTVLSSKSVVIKLSYFMNDLSYYFVLVVINLNWAIGKKVAKYIPTKHLSFRILVTLVKKDKKYWMFLKSIAIVVIIILISNIPTIAVNIRSPYYYNSLESDSYTKEAYNDIISYLNTNSSFQEFGIALYRINLLMLYLNKEARILDLSNPIAYSFFGEYLDENLDLLFNKNFLSEVYSLFLKNKIYYFLTPRAKNPYFKVYIDSLKLNSTFPNALNMFSLYEFTQFFNQQTLFTLRKNFSRVESVKTYVSRLILNESQETSLLPGFKLLDYKCTFNFKMIRQDTKERNAFLFLYTKILNDSYLFLRINYFGSISLGVYINGVLSQFFEIPTLAIRDDTTYNLTFYSIGDRQIILINGLPIFDNIILSSTYISSGFIKILTKGVSCELSSMSILGYGIPSEGV